MPDPVVHDLQDVLAGVLLEPDRDAGGARVLADVGERLVRDPDQGPGDDRRGLALDVDQHPDGWPRPRGVGRGPQSDLDVVVLDRRLVELDEQPSEPGGRLAHAEVEDLELGAALRREHRVERPPQRLEPDVDGRHHLDRVVVDVPGDPLALRLLRLVQVVQQAALVGDLALDGKPAGDDLAQVRLHGGQCHRLAGLGSVMRKDDTWTGMPSPVGQCRSVVSPVHRPSAIDGRLLDLDAGRQPLGVRKSAIDVVVTSTSSGTPASRRPPGIDVDIVPSSRASAMNCGAASANAAVQLLGRLGSPPGP